MGVQYSQLTEEERIEIYALKKAGFTMRAIACALKRDPKTIRTEIERNTGGRGYRPKQAHAKALERRAQPRRPAKMTPDAIEFIQAKLREDYSPEQISAVMEEAGLEPVSHERIYRHVYEDQAAGGDLAEHLRIATKKKRRKRYGKKDWRGRIPGRVDIDQRPAEVEKREVVGHYEADLVVGKHHKGFLVTLVERASRFTLIGHVERKTSVAVAAEIGRLLEPLAEGVRSITFDNGREFAGHMEIAKTLDCLTYFAKPYHSWERGTNENTNGLIRQYFPKLMDLRGVSREDLEFVMNRLNHRPRKTLGFKTPAAVFSDDA
jgi:IS30 family transposase